MNYCTIPETNIAPEDRLSQKEGNFQSTSFQGEKLLVVEIYCSFPHEKLNSWNLNISTKKGQGENIDPNDPIFWVQNAYHGALPMFFFALENFLQMPVDGNGMAVGQGAHELPKKSANQW